MIQRFDEMKELGVFWRAAERRCLEESLEERGSIPNESPHLLGVMLILGEQPGFPTEPLQPADQVFLSGHSAMMTPDIEDRHAGRAPR